MKLVKVATDPRELTVFLKHVNFQLLKMLTAFLPRFNRLALFYYVDTNYNIILRDTFESLVLFTLLICPGTECSIVDS